MSSIIIQEFLRSYRIAKTNIYAIPHEIYHQLDIKTWKYNRPVDENRVEEIRQWNKEFNRMDGVINLAYIAGDGLVCFEGNHRRLALKDLPITVIVDIIWNVNDEILVHEFRRINKSVSVPDFYIVDTDKNVKEDIENFIKHFRKTYPSHETPCGRPQRPNYNRDGLTDQITRIHKESDVTTKELFERIYLLNHKYSEKSRTKLSAKIIEKCEKTGLWLFAFSSVLSVKDILD